MRRFRINVLDPNGNPVAAGDGPIVAISSLVTTARLDEIGDLSFAMAAADPRAALISPGAQFDVFADGEGYVGRYLYRSSRLQADEGKLEVQGWDALRELTRRVVLFNRTYEDIPFDEIASGMVEDVLGNSKWIVDTGRLDPTTIEFNGETLFAACLQLAARWSDHLRLVPPHTLQIGPFGSSSGVRLANLEGQGDRSLAAYPAIRIAKPLVVLEEDDSIVNRVYPLGGGVGAAELTIEHANVAGAYAKVEGTNPDGSSCWYVEDGISQGQYGLREQVVKWPGLAPVSALPSAGVQAANALQRLAEWHLELWKEPLVVYEVSTPSLQTSVRPGDTVTISYRGMAHDRQGQPFRWIDVEEEVYVLDITRKRTATGAGDEVRLSVATTLQRRRDDASLLFQVTSDLRTLKYSVQPTAAEVADGPYYFDSFNSASPAEVEVQAGTHGIRCNYAELRFRTRAASGADHPQSVRLWADGVDVSGALGGPWGAAAPADEALDVTVNVTPYFQGDAQHRYTVKLTCGAGDGTAEIAVHALVTIKAVKE